MRFDSERALCWLQRYGMAFANETRVSMATACHVFQDAKMSRPRRSVIHNPAIRIIGGIGDYRRREEPFSYSSLAQFLPFE
jgi:hypothetical protein